ASQRPDVVVADIRMPPTFTDEGLRAALELRRTHPGTAVLVLSQYIETRYAVELLHGSPAGVGYLLKDRVADVAEFTDAVGRVAFADELRRAGHTVHTPDLFGRAAYPARPRLPPHPLALARQEPADRGPRTLGLVDVDHVPAVVEHLDAAARDPAAELLRVLHRDQRVLTPPDDERRHADAVQPPAEAVVGDRPGE